MVRFPPLDRLTFLGKLSYHLGTKERIAKGKEIQAHLEATIKARPDDFNAQYTYGRWCIEVAVSSN